MITTKRKIRIKPYSLGELAHLYTVDRRTLKKWIRPHAAAIGERYGHYYTARQVRAIFIVLGLPGDYEEID